MPTIKTKLNISGNTGIPPDVTLKQYDKTSDASGKQLQFDLYDGATLYTIPSGATVTIRGTKPDLTGYVYKCSFTGSTVTVNVQEQMTVCAGRHNAEVRIEKGGNILGTANVTLNVEKSSLNDAVPISKTDIPLIEKAVEAYDKATTKADEASASASSAKASADKAATSEKNAKASETNSANSAQKAEEAYKQASAIAGVGEFAYYVADDGMLHFKFKKGGI